MAEHVHTIPGSASANTKLITRYSFVTIGGSMFACRVPASILGLEIDCYVVSLAVDDALDIVEPVFHSP